MAAPRRTITCISCGAVVSRTYVKAKRGHCALCGIRRCQDNARQIHAKAGPYYDRWAAGLLKYAARLGAQVQAEQARQDEASRAALTPYSMG